MNRCWRRRRGHRRAVTRAGCCRRGRSPTSRPRPRSRSCRCRQRSPALIGGGAGGILSVQRDGLRNNVVMIAPAPLSSVQSEWERRGPTGAIVLVHDPEIGVRDAVEILEQGLRLPKGAARVVAALAGEDDLKSFAEREGVTIHTARFHSAGGADPHRRAQSSRGRAHGGTVAARRRAVTDRTLATIAACKKRKPPCGGFLYSICSTQVSANNIPPPDAAPSGPGRARR